MGRALSRCLPAVLCAASLALAAQDAGAPPALVVAGVSFEQRELDELAQFSPLPPPPGDPTNAVYEDPAAARLGQALFYDARLSGPGTFSCATCHDPARSWTDGRPLAQAMAHHPRHTMTLWNVAYNRWFFWDGRKDTLWSQALAPLEDPREQASNRLAIAHVLAGDPGYVRAYARLFGPFPDLSDARRFPAAGRPMPAEPEQPEHRAWAGMTAADQEVVNRLFVNLGKAIAAFERRLVSRHAPFDVFVEGVREHDPLKLAALDQSALRGLKLFLGKGRCALCHDGPNFTDLEFHDNRVPTAEGNVDPGRLLGIVTLKRDPFRSTEAFSDDAASAHEKLDFLILDDHRQRREFKTPTLRNVARTPPYMHEGQLATLEDVVRFYSSLAGAAPLREGGERIVQPLGLSAEEQADLVAFLRGLTDESLPAELLSAPPSPTLSQD